MSIRKKKVRWAKRVRRLRAKMLCSQTKLANIMGLSLSTISSWERGVRNPSGIAKAFLKHLSKQSRKTLRGLGA